MVRTPEVNAGSQASVKDMVVAARTSGAKHSLIQSGTGTIGGGGDLVVTFPETFKTGTVPKIVCTVTSATVRAINSTAGAATGFTAKGTATDTFDWVAVGEPSD